MYFFFVSGVLDIPTVKKEYGVKYIFKAICLVTTWMAMDENTQVNGVKVVVDCTDVTMEHATTLFGPENAKRLLGYYQVWCAA